MVKMLINFKAQNLSDGDARAFKMVYFRRWWGILSIAVQRAVALNLLGGDWTPSIAMVEPSEEELLCTTIVPPLESRPR